MYILYKFGVNFVHVYVINVDHIDECTVRMTVVLPQWSSIGHVASSLAFMYIHGLSLSLSSVLVFFSGWQHYLLI